MLPLYLGHTIRLYNGANQIKICAVRVFCWWYSDNGVTQPFAMACKFVSTEAYNACSLTVEIRKSTRKLLETF